MTYEQRVQDIAKSISEANNNGKWGPGLADWDKSMRAAHIAVAKMAELARQWVTAYAWTTEYLNEYLIEVGLIPDNSHNNDPSGPYAMGPGH